MSKLAAVLCLVCLMLTVLWLGLLIADMATAGPLETFEQVAAHASRLHGLFYATYHNVALLTVAAVALFAVCMPGSSRPHPAGSFIGLVFTPIYGVLNLVAYLSQVTLVPALVTLRLDPQTTAAADVLLRLTLQAWPQSAMAFFNGLAYAILGIPSMLYGTLLWRYGGALRWGGVLLALSGAASVLGVMGLLTGSALLAQGVMVGGILFLGLCSPSVGAFGKCGNS
jgi:hypothetical protein